MEDLLFALLMALLLAGYYLGQRLLNQYVTCVEAGPTAVADLLDLSKKSHYATKVTIMENGKAVSTKGMIRILVYGNCMKEKGIPEGSQLFVKKIPKNAKASEILKEGDILMLHHPNTNTDKLREFVGFTSNGELLTRYYDQSGTPHPSSHPQKRESLVGVAWYKIENH